MYSKNHERGFQKLFKGKFSEKKPLLPRKQKMNWLLIRRLETGICGQIVLVSHHGKLVLYILNVSYILYTLLYILSSIFLVPRVLAIQVFVV